MQKKAASSGVPAIIADKLRAMVARGSLGPGMRLGQTELAQQFSASRVPVREALKLLTSEGIVEHDPNRGFFVTRLSKDEAEQIFLMRQLIEDALLKTIEWPDKESLAELARRATRLENLLDKGDRLNWWNENREFHNMIFNLSPKKMMVREAMRLWSLSDRYRALLPMPRRPSAERNVVNKHSLISALRDKDLKKLTAVRRDRRDAFRDLVLVTLEDREL